MSIFSPNKSASRSASSPPALSARKRLSCTTQPWAAGSAIVNENVSRDDPVEGDARKHVSQRGKSSAWSKMVNSEIPERMQRPAQCQPLRRALPAHQSQRPERHHLQQLN